MCSKTMVQLCVVNTCISERHSDCCEQSVEMVCVDHGLLFSAQCISLNSFLMPDCKPDDNEMEVLKCL